MRAPSQLSRKIGSVAVRRSLAGASFTLIAAALFTSANAQQVCQAWITTEDLSKKIEKQADVPVVAAATGGTAMTIYPERRRQTILGTGTSMDETSVYNLARMSQAKRTEVLGNLFDSTAGINWNLVRLCFGTSDFCGVPWYTYDDMPSGQTDTSLAQFSIQKDIDYHIIEVLKEIRTINPDVLFYGTAWSPPAWMKVSKTVLGGNMDTQYIPVLARYYRKIVQAYAQQGIPLYAVSTQNEPDVADGSYPQCLMTAAQQMQLAAEMRKEFVKYGIATKIWGFDSNWGDTQMWFELLNDTPSRPYLEALAFHPYIGDASAQSTAHLKCPWIDVHMTERGGSRITNMFERFSVFQNWGRSYTHWIPVVDNSGSHINGPYKGSGGMWCPVVVSTTDPNAVTYKTSFYLPAMISKFVKRGAYYVENTGSPVAAVSFQNPDGKIVAVLANSGTTTQSLALRCNGSQVSVSLPAKSVGTYIWSDSKNVLPFAVISSPERTANLVLSGPTVIAASAWDPDPSGSVSAVEFFADSVRIAADSTAPYTCSWQPAKAGFCRLTARAWDNSGASQRSPETPVYVDAGAVKANPQGPRAWRQTAANNSMGTVLIVNAAGKVMFRGAEASVKGRRVRGNQVYFMRNERTGAMRTVVIAQ